MIREQNSAGQHFENGPKSLRFVSQDFALLCCSLHTLLIEAAAGACEPEGRKGIQGTTGKLDSWADGLSYRRPIGHLQWKTRRGRPRRTGPKGQWGGSSMS